MKKDKQKIEIKESNKGRFTDYCRGKVTDACISKGLGSPSEAVRKQAQFAKNAKSWDHSKNKKDKI